MDEHFRKSVGWVFVLTASIVGCDALYEGGGLGEPTKPIARLPEVVQQCTQDGTQVPYSTRDELVGLLEGQWEYCDGTSPLSRPNVAGIEVRPSEGHYYFLRRMLDGSLTRMNSFESDGPLEITDLGTEQNRFEIFLGSPANFVTQAEFTVQPRKLRFDPSVYVFRGTDTSVTSRCAQDGPLATYTALAELKTLVSGRWAYCGGVSPLSLPDATGIEIDADAGEYYFLKDDGQGGYVRATGFDGGGSLQLYQPAGSSQWRLLFGSPANFDTSAEFMSNPEKLRLNPSQYVRIP